MSLSERTRLSREQRHQDVLDALGNSTMTATEVGQVLAVQETTTMSGQRYTHSRNGRTWELYGCAKRGCDAINPDYLSYGAYGKSWCLEHPPLRVRVRRWLGQDV